MSDSEEETITRVKKPLSEAKRAAIEKMKEGRKRSLEAKRKLKEEEKQKKKDMKKKIKMKVEEEMNGLESLPTSDLEELKQKAIEPILKKVEAEPAYVDTKIDPRHNPTGEVDPNLIYSDEDSEEEVVVVKKPKKKKAKKKVAIHNYYDEDEPELYEEEIHNHFRKSPQYRDMRIAPAPAPEPAPAPIEPEVESEEEEEYYQEPLYRHPPSAMSGIRFV